MLFIFTLVLTYQNRLFFGFRSFTSCLENQARFERRKVFDP